MGISCGKPQMYRNAGKVLTLFIFSTLHEITRRVVVMQLFFPINVLDLLIEMKTEVQQI